MYDTIPYQTQYVKLKINLIFSSHLTWIIHGPRPTPPHPYKKVEEAACEGTVFYIEQAAKIPMP